MRRVAAVGRCMFTLIAVLCGASDAWGVAPPYVSDADLAQYPVIVVARWNKAPVRDHSLVEGNTCKEWEVFTDVVVERVISGDVKPGTHTVMLGFFIGWDEEGQVMSYMSTQMPGDARKVTDRNLWFFTTARSWDKKDPKTYLKLDTYRGVQPVVLEPYYEVLRAKQTDKGLGPLLRHKDPLVVLRTLRYLCGERGIWPDDVGVFDRYRRPSKPRRPLVQYGPVVGALLDGKEPRIRRQAAKVYAFLQGDECIGRMRTLLSDKDAYVRGVALGTLAQYGDAPSCEAICRAARGMEHKNGLLACRIVDALDEWGDPRIVPALIEFLQNDTYAYRIGEDIGIPALKARKALLRITGHEFPCDVARSREAWQKVDKIRNRDDRKKALAKVLPGGASPLAARLVCRNGELVVVVTNRSEHAVVLAKMPQEIDRSWHSGIASRGYGAPEGKEGFVNLEPGRSLRFEIDWSNLGLPGNADKLTLTYTCNGNRHGVNAWIGALDVAIGKASNGPAAGAEKPGEP